MFDEFEIAWSSHTGKVRQDFPNQDAIGVFTPGFFHHRAPLLILADGMGGHFGGELASKIVIETFKKTYLKNRSVFPPDEILVECVRQSHRAIRAASQKDQEFSKMGSTVVATILKDQQLYAINVGDSRLYLFRDRRIHQISYDQSVVAEMVRKGEITEGEAAVHPQKNQLTMSIIARREKVIPYCAEQSLEMNDVILLCSDGLWGAVSINLIQAIACQLKPRLAVNKLVETANRVGGPDNISVIIARRKGSVLESENDDEEGD